MTKSKVVLISVGILFVGIGGLVSWIGVGHSNLDPVLSGITMVMLGGVLIGVNL